MNDPVRDDRRMGRLIGALLRLGVSLATLAVLAGAVVLLIRHGTEVPEYRTFRGEPASLRGVVAIARDIAHPGGRGLIQLGLVLLVATPVARVVLSLVAFAAQRDRRFVVITLLVLAILAYGLLGPPP